jgi:hypothetical protein
MHIMVCNDDLLNQEADAVLLTIDGAAPGMEGNVARAFERRYPDLWEELSTEIEYPLPLGRCDILEIDHYYTCPHRFAVIASTLHHHPPLSDQQKRSVAESAFLHALALCSQRHVHTVATTVLTGGWRLGFTDALSAMLAVAERFRENQNTPFPSQVKICVLDGAALAAARASGRYPSEIFG